MEKNKKAYKAAYSKNLLDKLFKNHINQGYSTIRWTREKLQKEADKCKTRGEFWKNIPAASAAHSKNLMDELFKNHTNKGHTPKKKEDGYWTEIILQDEVNKYKTRKEFAKKNGPAHTAAIRKHILDKLFKNHTNQGYSYKEWKENNYIIYVYELEEHNMAYVGLTNDMKRRDRDHLFSEKEALSMYCIENDIPYPTHKILEKDIDSKTAQEKEKYWVNYYKEKGWNMFNIAKPGSLGGFTVKWTKPKLQKEANKYKTRVEFRKKSSGAYDAAWKKNLMDELFKNHPNQGHSHKPTNYWTKKRLQDEANKYETIKEFREKNSGAYSTAAHKNLLKELFKNHTNQGHTTKKRKDGY